MNKEAVIVLVAMHTYEWTVKCVTSLRRVLPEVPILFIDNNPSLEDSEKRRESYKRSDPLGITFTWHKNCELEREFMRLLPNSFVVRTDVSLYHGEAINEAVKWCLHKRVPIMVHIEPDCFVTGSKWYFNLVNSIKSGNWMAGGTLWRKTLHITPTAWDVNVCASKQLNFMPASKHQDINHPRFSEVYDYENATGWELEGWDTGLRNWYLCAIEDKAQYVDTSDFTHFWNGTQKRKSLKTYL